MLIECYPSAPCCVSSLLMDLIWEMNKTHNHCSTMYSIIPHRTILCNTIIKVHNYAPISLHRLHSTFLTSKKGPRKVPLSTLVLSPPFATITGCSLDTKLLAIIVNVQTSLKYHLPAMHLAPFWQLWARRHDIYFV